MEEGKTAKRGPAKRGPPVVIFVSGLPRHVAGAGTKRALFDAFRPYGVYKVRVDKNSNGHNRGWAWVYVNGDAEREKAVVDLNLQLTVDNCVLRVSPASDRRDTLFPDVDHATRLSLRLDPEATFSCTDTYTARAMAQVCTCALEPIGIAASDSTVLDMTAAGGGNTLGFVLEGYGKVVGIEREEGRARDLRHNMDACGAGKVEVVGGVDSVCWLAECQEELHKNMVVFMDPPWGGTDYTAKSTPHTDFPLGNETVHSLVSDIFPKNPDIILAAIKLPTRFDFTALAKAVTSAETAAKLSAKNPLQANVDQDGNERGASLEERPFPYMFEFGVRTRLFVVAYPRGGPTSFKNSNLDAVIGSLNALNKVQGEELHGQFFDYEKGRWVGLHRWKGCTGVPAVK